MMHSGAAVLIQPSGIRSHRRGCSSARRLPLLMAAKGIDLNTNGTVRNKRAPIEESRWGRTAGLALELDISAYQLNKWHGRTFASVSIFKTLIVADESAFGRFKECLFPD